MKKAASRAGSPLRAGLQQGAAPKGPPSVLSPASQSASPPQKGDRDPPYGLTVYEMNYYQWQKICQRISDAREQALAEIRGSIAAEGREKVNQARQELSERVNLLERYIDGDDFRARLQDQIDRAIDSAVDRLAVEFMRTAVPQLVSVKLESFTRNSEIARLESKLASSYEFVRGAVEARAKECDRRYSELHAKYSKLADQCDRLRVLLKQARVSLPSDDGLRAVTLALEKRL